MSVMAEPQHLEALRAANDVRLRRAALKRRIASGEVTAAAVLREVPEEVRNMAIMELLMAQKRWGRERARRLLQKQNPLSPMSELRTVGEATARQRGDLAYMLERR